MFVNNTTQHNTTHTHTSSFLGGASRSLLYEVDDTFLAGAAGLAAGYSYVEPTYTSLAALSGMSDGYAL